MIWRVLSEARILAREPGFLVRLAEVNSNRLAIAEILDPETLTPLIDNDAPNSSELPIIGQVRRWEGGPPSKVVEETWTALENGIEVRFERGFVTPNDFWTMPARTITADIEWPRDPSSDAPIAKHPDGLERRYCALALVTRDGDGQWSVAEDCRHLFPPLIDFTELSYVGGDGQEARPGLQLDRPLQVGVANGEHSVEGARVRFTRVSGDGRVLSVETSLVSNVPRPGRFHATINARQS